MEEFPPTYWLVIFQLRIWQPLARGAEWGCWELVRWQGEAGQVTAGAEDGQTGKHSTFSCPTTYFSETNRVDAPESMVHPGSVIQLSWLESEFG